MLIVRVDCADNDGYNDKVNDGEVDDGAAII